MHSMHKSNCAVPEREYVGAPAVQLTHPLHPRCAAHTGDTIKPRQHRAIVLRTARNLEETEGHPHPVRRDQNA
jgi:hypothetical protein